jgi:peptidyl-prolyl cis-trans isomerase B (cyclophilin B)
LTVREQSDIFGAIHNNYIKVLTMTIKIFVTILVTLFVLPSLGCSGSDTSKQDDAAKVDITMTAANSLAMKTFPIRDDKNPFVTIETDFGNMTLELYRDVAPAHADSFIARTKDGFYNGLKFHRVIKNFMIQGGDPEGTGAGGAGYFLEAEFSDVPHQDGTLSMARSRSPHSASSQFFICLARNRSTTWLDGKYTVFGQLVKGYDVLHAIGDVEVVDSGRGEVSQPKEEVISERIYLSDAEGNEL